jgi:catechol 2,3-dioxygenase-like lactoylglutathione lyase family enzyme
MAGQIELGSIHHVRLTVTDIKRSREFYTDLLGFDVAVEAPASDEPKSDPSYPVLWGGVVMAKGNYLLGLRPVALWPTPRASGKSGTPIPPGAPPPLSRHQNCARVGVVDASNSAHVAPGRFGDSLWAKLPIDFDREISKI